MGFKTRGRKSEVGGQECQTTDGRRQLTAGRTQRSEIRRRRSIRLGRGQGTGHSVGAVISFDGDWIVKRWNDLYDFNDLNGLNDFNELPN